jgi:hypothetical protein
MTTQTNEGGCLCGSIRYRTSGDPVATSLCHCRSCRRASGAPTVAWAVFRSSDFTFVVGAPTRFHSSPGVTRTFCGNCGTPLTYQREPDTGTIDITTATLDHPDRFAPTCEIWIAHKISWETLNGSIPQHLGSSKR